MNKILIALVLAVVMSGNVHAKDKKLCRDLEIEISEQLEIFQMYLVEILMERFLQRSSPLPAR